MTSHVGAEALLWAEAPRVHSLDQPSPPVSALPRPTRPWLAMVGVAAGALVIAALVNHLIDRRAKRAR